MATYVYASSQGQRMHCKEWQQNTCKENTQENNEHQRKVDQKKLDNIKHNDGNVTMVSDEGNQVTSEEP